MKTPLFSIKAQGGPRVNAGNIVAEGKNVVALSVDLHSKYCEVGWVGSDKGTPIVGITRTERSLGLEKGKKDQVTELIFPTFKGWEVWSANCSRYTLRVCLVKLDSEDDE